MTGEYGCSRRRTPAETACESSRIADRRASGRRPFLSGPGTADHRCDLIPNVPADYEGMRPATRRAVKNAAATASAPAAKLAEGVAEYDLESTLDTRLPPRRRSVVAFDRRGTPFGRCVRQARRGAKAYGASRPSAGVAVKGEEGYAAEDACGVVAARKIRRVGRTAPSHRRRHGADAVASAAGRRGGRRKGGRRPWARYGNSWVANRYEAYDACRAVARGSVHRHRTMLAKPPSPRTTCVTGSTYYYHDNATTRG